MMIDPERVAAIIAEIAETEMMPRFGRLKPREVRQKSGPNDLVTTIDEKVEGELKRALLDLRPGAAFIGEEAAAADPTIMGALNGVAWVVDPIDGTRNFINGVPEFGVIVALVADGETQMGWIFAAPRQECAIAVRGKRATIAGEPIAVAKQSRPRPHGLRSLGWLPAERQSRMRAALAANFTTEPGHCAAYAYLRLARGEVDFKLSSRIHPWDHAAGALLLSEVGGETRWLDDGRPYAPQPSRDAPLLSVAAGRDWAATAAALRV